MASDRFLMDNGAGYHTDLWRHEIVRRTWTKIQWRDAPPGEKWEIWFDDIDGKPVDNFGIPLDGEFIDVSK